MASAEALSAPAALSRLQIMPRHEFADASLRPTVDEARQRIGEVGLRIDAVELAGLDQRGEPRPILSTTSLFRIELDTPARNRSRPAQ
jgi:hypothetical protein